MPLPGPLEILLILTICTGPLLLIGIVFYFSAISRKRMKKVEGHIEQIQRQLDQGDE